MSVMIAGLGVVLAIIALIVAVTANRRSNDLAQRLAATRRILRRVDDDLEAVERKLGAIRTDQSPEESKPIAEESNIPEARPTPPAPTIARPVRDRHSVAPHFDWEKFVGRRVLGWVAVGLVLLAASFFIKYAFDTVFGPTARIASGAVLGVVLCLIGGRYGARGQSRGCSMVCSAGLLLLYLSVYAAFGFFTLLQPVVGGAFLTAIVAEGVLLSVWYRARPLAYMALAGALLVPALLPADHDRYSAFFVYLVVVNVAAAALTFSIAHPVMQLLTYLGSQILFWVWFDGHYHPEKLDAVVALQVGLYLVWMLTGRFSRVRTSNWERISMWLATALCLFLSLHRIVDEEAPQWRGVLTIGFAVWYSIRARIALPAASRDTVRIATLLALAFGFLGIAIPIQSDAPWTAIGWAAIGTVLWLFGLRIREPLLRAGGLVFLFGSFIALTWTWANVRADTVPVPLFNQRSMPMLGVAACLLVVAESARRLRDQLNDWIVPVRYAAGLGAVALIGIVLTWETWNTGRDILDLSDTEVQTTLSIVWAVYAAALLAVGFIRVNPPMRWTGLALLALTLLKLIGYDLSELPAIYRALTFLAVAVVTAAAAWGYRRVSHIVTEASHD